jgi:hypothetical protein
VAAPWNPPVKNEDFEFDVCLEDYANPGRFKANPTLASGDVKISKDEGGFANLATLPTVAPASGVQVQVELTGTEMNADKVTIVFSDQTVPPEWCDYAVTIITQSA